jgi:hypothetical protein
MKEVIADAWLSVNAWYSTAYAYDGSSSPLAASITRYSGNAAADHLLLVYPASAGVPYSGVPFDMDMSG